MTTKKMRVLILGILALCLAYAFEWIDIPFSRTIALGGAWACAVWLWERRFSKWCCVLALVGAVIESVAGVIFYVRHGQFVRPLDVAMFALFIGIASCLLVTRRRWWSS